MLIDQEPTSDARPFLFTRKSLRRDLVKRRQPTCNQGVFCRRASAIARGFTLIELMLVLAIVVTTTAIAVPLVQNVTSRYELRSAVASVSGAILATRYQALYQGLPYAIAFNSANSNYQVSSAPSISGTFTNIGSAVPFSTGPLLSQNTSMVFRPSGAVQPSATTACPSNGTASTLTLTYGGNTGTITVSCYGNVGITYTP